MPETAPRRIVCLGEALVDLACERPAERLADADSFVPRAGGSLANIATVAARFGAPVEIVGGAGDDAWGEWLRAGLTAEGVGVEHFRLCPGPTALAFITVSAEGEPSFDFRDGGERPAAWAAPALDSVLSGVPGVLVVGTDTWVDQREREVTREALRLAAERGWTVLCDPNLRPRRWRSQREMLERTRELVAAADIIKCNREEAIALAEEADVEAAASSLLGGRRGAVVVTMAANGALVDRGAGPERISAPEAEVVDATGGGDAVAGIAAAALSLGDESDLPAAIELAMTVAAGVVGTWGALDGLPEPAWASASLARALAA